MTAARLVTWADGDGNASAKNILDCRRPGSPRLRANPGGGGPLRLALLSSQLSAIVRVPRWGATRGTLLCLSRMSM